MPLTTDDQLAIQQLYARYNHAIDSGNGDAWAACFTPTGTFTSGTGSFAGTEQLAPFAVSFAARVKGRHWTNNLVVEAAEGGASGTCYLMLLRLGNAEKPTGIMTTAIYKDRLNKDGGAWKFASREVVGDA
jgi:3-phenylpropionate/cinnamic acid dioxygenase small subunit